MKPQKNNPSANVPGESTSAHISVYISALQATYRPASDPQHVTHWFTTAEVYEAIKQLNPSADISKEQIFQAMAEAGFRFQNRPGASGCEFRWMLEEKNE